MLLALLVGELGRHGSGLSPNPLLVFGSVLTVASVGLCLGGVLDVGVVQEVLDAQKKLFDRDRGPAKRTCQKLKE